MADLTITSNNGFATMARRTADLDELWGVLSASINRIMNEPGRGLPYAEHTNVNTKIYKYCKSPKIRAHGDQSSLRDDQACSDLYDKLSGFFEIHSRGMLQNVDTLSDMDLLQFYAAEWDRYKTSADNINRLFTYINRYWVKQQQRNGKAVFPVYTLALLKWKEYFFQPIQADNAKLTTTFLHLLTAQRNGESIDEEILKKVVDSFVSLGLDKSGATKECLDLYKDKIETAPNNAEEVDH